MYDHLISKEDLNKVQKHFLEIGKGKSSIIKCRWMFKDGQYIHISMKSIAIAIDEMKVSFILFQVFAPEPTFRDKSSEYFV